MITVFMPARRLIIFRLFTMADIADADSLFFFAAMSPCRAPLSRVYNTFYALILFDMSARRARYAL